jgi:hypothetical protein
MTGKCGIAGLSVSRVSAEARLAGGLHFRSIAKYKFGDGMDWQIFGILMQDGITSYLALAKKKNSDTSASAVPADRPLRPGRNGPRDADHPERNMDGSRALNCSEASNRITYTCLQQ